VVKEEDEKQREGTERRKEESKQKRKKKETHLNALGAALASSLVLVTTGLGLLVKELGAVLLGLGGEDVLHQNTLVLEGVTLGLHVKGVVKVLVNLLGLPVLAEEPPQDTHTPHPDNLLGHTGVGGTLPLTGARVATLPLGEEAGAGAGPGVHSLGLPDHKAVLDELTDILA